jgi:hypothetical protein
MSNNVRPLSPGQNIVTGGGGDGGSIVDRFAQVFAIARPTLDAIVKLRDARTWFADRQRCPTLMLNLHRALDEEDEAKARIAIIPEMAVLKEAAQLFDDATRKAAPEPWYHLAIGTMLASMPNAKNVAPDYQFGVVDMLLNDEANWERDCAPGFSPAIFVCAIRQVRREEEFVPTAAKILKACKEQRKRFRQLGLEAEVLIDVRENAEQIIKGAAREYEDLFGDQPFEPTPPRPPGWRPPDDDDEDDLPF